MRSCIQAETFRSASTRYMHAVRIAAQDDGDRDQR